MGIGCEYPSPVAFRHKWRAHLLGEESKLLGSGYNVDKECFADTLTNNNQLSPNDSAAAETELCLLAMMLASVSADEADHLQEKVNTCDKDPKDIYPSELENEMKTEGMRCLGGYTAHKYAQYDSWWDLR